MTPEKEGKDKDKQPKRRKLTQDELDILRAEWEGMVIDPRYLDTLDEETIQILLDDQTYHSTPG